MRVKMRDIPAGYLSGFFESVFLIVLMIGFSFFAFFHLDKVMKIPSPPKKTILEKAFIYRDVSMVSKTTSKLFLTVGTGGHAYDYVIEASTRDIQFLDFNKSRMLWVAVEADRRRRFVWAIYDDGLGLLISRQEILAWMQYRNTVNYSVVAVSGVGTLCLFYLVFRYGFWNRLLAKRMARENRRDG